MQGTVGYNIVFRHDHCPRSAREAPGDFRVQGQVIMRPAHGSGLLSTAEAARLVGVQPVTIRQWRSLGWLDAQGLSERGYPMHSADAVREAERKVRQNSITKGHFDPRRTRGRTRREAA